uniref:Uncharacterized protein n=1 Tax=Anopheles farauti TaxID=69004 RepID=A0A182Q0Q8_9DIPT
MPLDQAHLWKRRLSLLYAVVAWNAFGGVCYMIYTGRNDWAKFYGYKSDEEAQLPQAVRFAKQLNLPNAKVIKFNGITKTDEYELKDMQVLRPNEDGFSNAEKRVE